MKLILLTVIIVNMVDTNFTSRLESYLELYNKVVCNLSHNALCDSEWGFEERMKTKLNRLKDLEIFSLYLLMLEWKVYEQNTFFLQQDDEGCYDIKYPSTIADEDLVQCFRKFFNCNHSIDLVPLLKVVGAYPLGVKPDGISYMIIDSSTDPCDDNIFEVNKP